MDRVLHDRPHVKPEIRKKILDAIAESGYQPPNRRMLAPPVSIGFLMPNWHNSYFSQQIYDGIRQAEQTIGDPNLTLVVRQTSADGERELIDAINEMTAQPLHGLILNVPQYPLLLNKVDALSRRGMPIITYDADLPQSGRICFVGQNLHQAGAVAAGLMARFLSRSDKLLIVTGDMEFNCFQGRIDGFIAEMRSLGFPPSFYELRNGHEDFDCTSSCVFDALRTQNIRAVYMASESVAGCMDGIRRAAPAHPVHVICNDLTPDAQKYLRSGQIDFVIAQRFTQKSEHAVRMMYDLLRKGIRPSGYFHHTETRIVTADML